MTELILYIPPGRAWGAPHMSPFCGKLETYLRMTGTPHRIEPASFTKAPKGKIPFVAMDGELMGDSQLIIERLEGHSPRPLDVNLSARDRAIGRAVRRMLEEATYFTGIYLRWSTDAGFIHVREELGKVLPAPLRLLLPLIRRKAKKTVVAQGTGRHSFDEICALSVADFQACAEILGDKPFLLGDAPHVCDATLYAFLEGFLRFPNDTPAKQAVAKIATLGAYRDRVRARWWADLDPPRPS